MVEQAPNRCTNAALAIFDWSEAVAALEEKEEEEEEGVRRCVFLMVCSTLSAPEGRERGPGP